jgi:hypothetical protein
MFGVSCCSQRGRECSIVVSAVDEGEECVACDCWVADCEGCACCCMLRLSAGCQRVLPFFVFCCCDFDVLRGFEV